MVSHGELCSNVADAKKREMLALVEIGRKGRPGRKWQKKGPINFSRISCYGRRGSQVENGGKREIGQKMMARKKMAEIGRKKAAIGFRAFLIDGVRGVTLGTARFPSIPYYYLVRNKIQ